MSSVCGTLGRRSGRGVGLGWGGGLLGLGVGRAGRGLGGGFIRFGWSRGVRVRVEWALVFLDRLRVAVGSVSGRGSGLGFGGRRAYEEGLWGFTRFGSTGRGRKGISWITRRQGLVSERWEAERAERSARPLHFARGRLRPLHHDLISQHHAPP